MNHVLPITSPSRIGSSVLTYLKSIGFSASQPPYTYWQARGDGATVTLYKSGKLMIQGRRADSLLDELQPLLGDAGSPQTSSGGDHHGARVEERATGVIGSDEVGKGDYFGPLVVCAAMIPPEEWANVQRTGVTDSKKLTDERCAQLAGELEHLPHALRILMPMDYNALWSTLRNVNRVLDHMHQQALTQVMAATGVRRMVTDRYATDAGLKVALGPSVDWHAEPKAESLWPSVAVASVIARAAFVREMAALERQWELDLHKGAGAPTLADAQRFVACHGEEALGHVAKLHFRTTQQVLATPLGF